jgi:hypothetical protein
VNNERRPGRRRSRIARIKPTKRSPRCWTCGGFVSSLCELCRGAPDPGVTIEEIVRGQNAVDRATRGRREQ